MRSTPGHLPAEVEELLVEVVADGFAVYCCGPKAAPHALVAAYEWENYVDLLTIGNFDRVTTARVPARGTVDIFAPEVVVWAYEGSPEQALRALLELVHPAHPDAPTTEYPAPAGLHVPRARQRPMTIRLPSPDLVRPRATRLALPRDRRRSDPPRTPGHRAGGPHGNDHASDHVSGARLLQPQRTSRP
ncbi:MAG: hypothetical protein ACRDRA_03740 [Pseudonocardiaceae bacterium]